MSKTQPFISKSLLDFVFCLQLLIAMPDLSKTNLSIKELYAQYWHCRDFEIQNLWQRSIFLGTFLILCFTGYGFFSVRLFLRTTVILSVFGVKQKNAVAIR